MSIFLNVVKQIIFNLPHQGTHVYYNNCASWNEMAFNGVIIYGCSYKVWSNWIQPKKGCTMIDCVYFYLPCIAIIQ